MNVNDAVRKALSYGTGLTSEQTEQLNIKGLSEAEKARMTAQMLLQNQQDVVTFITNLLKKKGEISMSIINNIR